MASSSSAVPSSTLTVNQREDMRSALISYLTDIIMSRPEYNFTVHTRVPAGTSQSVSLITLSTDQQARRDRIVLTNPSAGILVTAIGNPEQIAYLLHRVVGTNESLPATRKSIEEMAYVKGNEDQNCVICLDPYESDRFAREMPCKHIYHNDCITKWLENRGTCPICRYEMPLEKNGQEENNGVSRVVWLTISFDDVLGGVFEEDGDAGEEDHVDSGDGEEGSNEEDQVNSENGEEDQVASREDDDKTVD